MSHKEEKPERKIAQLGTDHEYRGYVFEMRQKPNAGKRKEVDGATSERK